VSAARKRVGIDTVDPRVRSGIDISSLYKPGHWTASVIRSSFTDKTGTN